MNSNPPNGSVIAHLPGAINATVIECNVFQDFSGEPLQVTTTWSLLNFMSLDEVIVNTRQFDGLFLIGGTPTPPKLLSRTYRNRITVINFTEDFDGTILCCGTEKKGLGYFNFRVYSKVIHMHAKVKS